MPPYVLTEADQRHLIDGCLRVLDRVLPECDALAGTAAATPTDRPLNMA
jgi:hypothetical protein